MSIASGFEIYPKRFESPASNWFNQNFKLKKEIPITMVNDELIEKLNIQDISQLDTSDVTTSVVNHHETIDTSRVEKLKEFSKLIRKRSLYLDSLNRLGNGWISGTDSQQPALHVLELSKDIISSLFQIIQSNDALPIPNLIMGPIPRGGISVALEVVDEFLLQFSIFNNADQPVIEYQHHGMYEERPSNQEGIKEDIIGIYERLSSRDA